MGASKGDPEIEIEAVIIVVLMVAAFAILFVMILA